MFKIRCEDDENGELRLFKSFREPYIERLIDFTFNWSFDLKFQEFIVIHTVDHIIVKCSKYMLIYFTQYH